MVAVYENYDTGYEMRRSTDEGSTWGSCYSFPIHSITNDKGTARINIANSEIIQLANGDLLAACNYRPQTPEITPFAIAVRRSTDNGVTWSDPQIIYEAELVFLTVVGNRLFFNFLMERCKFILLMRGHILILMNRKYP